MKSTSDSGEFDSAWGVRNEKRPFLILKCRGRVQVVKILKICEPGSIFGCESWARIQIFVARWTPRIPTVSAKGRRRELEQNFLQHCANHWRAGKESDFLAQSDYHWHRDHNISIRRTSNTFFARKRGDFVQLGVYMKAKCQRPSSKEILLFAIGFGTSLCACKGNSLALWKISVSTGVT